MKLLKASKRQQLSQFGKAIANNIIIAVLPDYIDILYYIRKLQWFYYAGKHRYIILYWKVTPRK